jgi:mono/diheme cytochrome c family protein
MLSDSRSLDPAVCQRATLHSAYQSYHTAGGRRNESARNASEVSNVSALLLRSLLALGIGSGLLLGTASAEEPEVDLVLAELGAPYYRVYCASCHGLDGKGGGPAAIALRTRPADLTHIAERHGGAFPDGEIAKFIDGRFEVSAHGNREMPVWGDRLTEGIPDARTADAIARGKIVVMVEYLKSIQARGD